MGSIAFSNIVQLKSLSTKCKAQKVTEMVRFSQRDNTIDLRVQTKVPAGRKKGISFVWFLSWPFLHLHTKVFILVSLVFHCTVHVYTHSQESILC